MNDSVTCVKMRTNVNVVAVPVLVTLNAVTLRVATSASVQSDTSCHPINGGVETSTNVVKTPESVQMVDARIWKEVSSVTVTKVITSTPTGILVSISTNAYPVPEYVETVPVSMKLVDIPANVIVVLR